MKVSGFTFIKDALIYDYPIVEAILSILPVCDEVIVAVGKSKDDTLGLIQQIDNPKIRIIETIWDESLREGGAVLAMETNKAFAAISPDADWAFYIQGDEVIHEKYLETIKSQMLAYEKDMRVDGFLFNYLHFYGSYDYVGSSSRWYKHEIRVIRNNRSIYSYRDAQGFRKGNDEKLNVVPLDAYVYHYGWVREPGAMQRKEENFHKYWHDDAWVEQKVIKADRFDYENHVSELKPFLFDQPGVMKKRIASKNWKFEFDISRNTKTLKEKAKDIIARYFGLDFNYKNYKLLK
ncbi:MAG: glycosyltransferase family 2 protein [Saprospiraceae bacterium]|uniref:Glycosyltransferase family 2 protein n=1 Tax=Candidatus Opimibacter skivensis TaxID=2982028 RepID=A0A9D7SZQ2_9BACT|nr:glycosyltransferase family 2 protein [Candidatus Opimibacter skivensis]